MSSVRHDGGLLDQPKAVWAVAFAAVVAFMGIGLVDPILPAIAHNLDAGPSQVELLFTSYFAVTGVAMLVTGVVSSRIGAKKTLLGGLALVVVFATLAGASGSIGEIAGFRAGWGLGNALFIATALAVIVGSASGGVAQAIILYEAALGLGIASGPLLGGLLGNVSWRGPFFGTAALMAVGFVAIAVLLEDEPPRGKRTSLADPIRALSHGGLAVCAIVALLYNFGFFTLLAYTPLPIDLGAIALGGIFFGWGLMVAVFSVAGAPPLQRRFGLVRTLAVAMALVAADLLVMGFFADERAVLIAGVIVAGAFLGVVNTVLTETVMKVSPVERPVASAAYSFVRFTGGAVAPFVAGKLAEHVSTGSPFFLGTVTVTAAVVVLTANARRLSAAEAKDDESAAWPAAARPVVAAIDASPGAASVTTEAARLALSRHAPLELVHVRETDVVGFTGIDQETPIEANAALHRHLHALEGSGIQVEGRVIATVGDHGDAARAVLARVHEVGAQALVVGHPTNGSGPLRRSLTSAATEDAEIDVVVAG